jgi:hypothetical protein
MGAVRSAPDGTKTNACRVVLSKDTESSETSDEDEGEKERRRRRRVKAGRKTMMPVSGFVEGKGERGGGRARVLRCLLGSWGSF